MSSVIGDQPQMPTVRPDVPLASIKSFVGRERELDIAEQALARTRLVTFKGPAGVGKTSLAHQLATRMEDRDGVDVVTVELAAVEATDAGVEGALVKRFGLLNNSDTVTTVQLMRFLRDQHLLLVLDNAEHLVVPAGGEAAPLPKLVRALLGTAPGVKILVTSQFRLGIGGAEYVLDVPPLSCAPTGDDTLSEALQLVRDRVPGSKPLDTAEHEIATRACQAVDGIPLAVEMMSGLRDAMTWPEILDGLQDPLNLLVTDDAEHTHHHSLHAAMRLTHELLDEPLHNLWAVLSVFPGTFDADAATAVSEGTGIKVGHPRRALTSLVHRSVLTQEERRGRSWYAMVAPIRHFGIHANADLVDRARIAHTEHFLEVARRAAEQWYGPDEVEWMYLLDTHMPSLRTAVRHLLEHAEPCQALELALNLCLTRYFPFAGVLTEGRRLLETCLEAQGDTASILIVQALALGAWTATIQGKHTVAAALLEQADHHLARLEPDTPRPEALDYAELAYAFITERDPARARMSVLALHEHARRTGDPMAYLFAAIDAGFHADRRTAYDIADTHLANATHSGAPWVISWALWASALVEHHHGTPAKALELLQQALRMQVDMGDTWGPAWTLWLIAVVTAHAGNHLVATQLFAGAWARQRRTDVVIEGLQPWLRVQTRAVLACRAVLGDRRFEIEREQADLTLSYEDVVELALSLPSPAAAGEATDLPPGGLSRREYDIVRLLAADPALTNPQLAARLHIARRSAEHLLFKARAKTGVEGRDGFTRWLAEQPHTTESGRA
ncbi:AAA family ATPase [Umezawaea sp. Da 62-37]|uniref:ATP-binding protein n=1 Tax=Umezawaea sp. Da 62-37 TaxID=3075927 RepID=UPI0028F71313|nr:AAA family ATPase [Umezawaea sp. Da 62-37]WNV83060.1 NACHT domain-containing protein [Umezawaea sp. Da 62-37]